MHSTSFFEKLRFVYVYPAVLGIVLFVFCVSIFLPFLEDENE